MNLATIRANLAAAIAAQDTTLNTYASAPDNPTVPCAFVWPNQGTFLTFDTLTSATGAPDSASLVVTVLVARGSDTSGQAKLDAYLASTDLWAANLGNLSNACSYARFTEARNYGQVQVGEIVYYGVELVVEVAA